MANGVKVSIDQLPDELARQLKSFGDGVRDGINTAVDESAEELKKILHSTSPSRGGRGTYKGRWQVTQTSTGLAYTKTVHNNKKYQLSHLLENPHRLRGGGVGGQRVHIAPAEKKVLDNFQKRAESIIEKQGGG